MSSNVTNEIATILGTVLGIFFFLPGVLKLVGNNLSFWRWARQHYLKVYPVWVYYLSGVVELVGGIALLFSGLRFYGALIIAALIAGLAVSRPLHKTNLKLVGMTLMSLAPLALVMFLTHPGLHNG